MRRFSYSDQISPRGVEINVVPLIDIMVFLLIFFITTTVFAPQTGVDVQKPMAATAVTLARDSMLIALTRDGQIVYGGRPLALNDVRGVVAQQQHAQPCPVVIVADQASRAGLLVDLIDECKLAGAAQVSIAAAREEP
jgi:biopolymer transport protein ExbD